MGDLFVDSPIDRESGITIQQRFNHHESAITNALDYAP
jgi:hypothetical protein